MKITNGGKSKSCECWCQTRKKVQREEFSKPTLSQTKRSISSLIICIKDDVKRLVCYNVGLENAFAMH